MSALGAERAAKGRAAALVGRLLRLGAGLTIAAGVAAAQDSTVAPGSPAGTRVAQPATAARSLPMRTVSGRVERPGRDGMIAVPNVWVTVHRVAPDSSGPVDSVRTDGTGRYVVRYRPTDDDAVYFASGVYGGVAYFTPPLPAGDAGGDAAEITVFDTTSGPVAIHTRGRHLVVSSSGADGRRTLVEVFELSNDSTVTAVAGARRRATWSGALPPNARDFQVGQSDINGDAVEFRDGRVLVYASLAPGIRQVAFSYSVPASDFPLALPITDPVTVFEVLLEDPGATASGGGLAEQPAVTLEGRTFRRYLGQDVKAPTALTIDAGAPTAPPANRYILAAVAIVAALMCVALAFALTRRRPAPVRAPREQEPDAARLARDIAELDDAFARVGAPSDAERDAYLRRREALKARLTSALANEGVPV